AAQMAAWYNSGTVLVCTSDAEGTPNVALEAAACGCTVVSTRVGNMPELIRDGWNGYLVERELSALHAAVRRACDDYPRLATAMLDSIRDWDWRRSAAEHFALFREVCAEP
ncbi:MAG: glycosyltransferase, partial [bacterium]